MQPGAESNGFFLDGESPVPTPVRAQLQDEGIRFAIAESRKNIVWEFSAINWEMSGTLNARLRLKHKEQDNWLVITAPSLIADIEIERKHWSRRNFWAARPDSKIAVRAGLGTILVCVLLWLTWPQLTGPLTVFVPQDTRDWLSSTTRQFAGMTRTCQNPAGEAALHRLTIRLTANRPELRQASIIAVKSNLVNALALANDKIVITSAIIAQAASPDEIAGIVAHEFGHVAHRHVLRGFLGQFSLQMLFTIFTGVHGSQIGYINDLTSNAYSRKHENEADTTGIALLRDAKISPAGLAEFFHRLAANDKSRARSFGRYFQTHPPSHEREQLMLDARVTDATPAMDLRDWQAVKSMCGRTARLDEAPGANDNNAQEEKPENAPASPDQTPGPVLPPAGPDEPTDL